MKVQVLLATMNRNDLSILNKMNIQTDIIIGNQCDKNEIKDELYNGHRVKWLSFAEKGVGLNRNNTLMRAESDICLFADDDVQYVDGYEKIITNFYDQHTDADVVIFNMSYIRPSMNCNEELVSRTRRIRRWSATKYGTFCVSIKLSSVRFANIFFHMEFGGGTKHCCGEDTIFLQDCFKKRLHVYTSNTNIGKVIHSESTWFVGFNKKYFFDKGLLFYHLYPRMYKIISLYNSFKHRKEYADFGWSNAYKIMTRAGVLSTKMEED